MPPAGWPAFPSWAKSRSKSCAKSNLLAVLYSDECSRGRRHSADGDHQRLIPIGHVRGNLNVYLIEARELGKTHVQDIRWSQRYAAERDGDRRGHLRNTARQHSRSE